MSIDDLRGSWPCGWCDSQPVPKRGTICAACQLKLDHGRRFHDDDPPKLPEEPAHPFRSYQDVDVKDELL